LTQDQPTTNPRFQWLQFTVRRWLTLIAYSLIAILLVSLALPAIQPVGEWMSKLWGSPYPVIATGLVLLTGSYMCLRHLGTEL